MRKKLLAMLAVPRLGSAALRRPGEDMHTLAENLQVVQKVGLRAERRQQDAYSRARCSKRDPAEAGRQSGRQR